MLHERSNQAVTPLTRTIAGLALFAMILVLADAWIEILSPVDARIDLLPPRFGLLATVWIPVAVSWLMLLSLLRSKPSGQPWRRFWVSKAKTAVAKLMFWFAATLLVLCLIVAGLWVSDLMQGL
jgi:hypothetical protein